MSAWEPQTPRSLGSLLATAMIGELGPELGDTVEGSADGAGVPVLDVPRAMWIPAARYVRNEWGLDFFDWLSAVDNPDGEEPGANIVLHIAASRAPSRRLLLRTFVPDADPTLPTLGLLWPGAAWHERETFEMFGIIFDGFDDGSGQGLRPLLLPDGFEGTPLRKSFVLTARVSKPWPGAKEPGESDAGPAEKPSGPPGRAPRKKNLPPGVPDATTWGPRDA
jgi:NADH-quinone oxidoreductase subunit C